MDLLLENVRCFPGKHRIPIRPLTFLVGENSTGKTTVLATLAAVLSGRAAAIPPVLSFPPFDMGPFSAVLSSTKRPARKADAISVGYEVASSSASLRSERCRLVEKDGAADICEFTVTFGDLTVSLSHSEVGSWLHKLEYKGKVVPLGGLPSQLVARFTTLYEILPSIGGVLSPQSPMVRPYNRLLIWLLGEGREAIVALAPMRSRPERTYDNPSGSYSPEGDHVPYFLAGIGGNGKNGKDASAILKKLKEYGIGSGLFKDIKIKRWGRKPGQPFQVLVSLAGQQSNLPDVGYGVSQALPVVVESLRAKKGARILMQQPEVHLHPRAQAALGSLFCALVKDEGKKFVIETHSDYMVDRARMEVARGTISADDFQILYFERKGKGVSVHPIHVDDLGNIIDAPPNYREFFLHEQMDLLSRGAKKRR